MAVSLALIIILSLLSDYLLKKTHLPGLLGMLFIGIICGPFVWDLIQPELLPTSTDLRMVAALRATSFTFFSNVTIREQQK